MKQRKTLAAISHQLNNLVSSMGNDPLYYSAPYDNKQAFDVLSDAVHEVVEANHRVVGWVGVKKVNEHYRVGVVVYPDENTRRKAETKGVNYDRMCF